MNQFLQNNGSCDRGRNATCEFVQNNLLKTTLLCDREEERLFEEVPLYDALLLMGGLQRLSLGLPFFLKLINLHLETLSRQICIWRPKKPSAGNRA